MCVMMLFSVSYALPHPLPPSARFTMGDKPVTTLLTGGYPILHQVFRMITNFDHYL